MSSNNNELWLVYAVNLVSKLGLTPGPKSKVYIAPLSYAGIAAGKHIPDAITNQGIFTIADTLLDPSSPNL